MGEEIEEKAWQMIDHAEKDFIWVVWGEETLIFFCKQFSLVEPGWTYILEGYEVEQL